MRAASIIRAMMMEAAHASTSQKILSFILAAVRTWNLIQLTSMGRLLYVVFDDSLIALMMEVARTSETSVDIQLRTRQYIHNKYL
jgi:hypothetical protein